MPRICASSEIRLDPLNPHSFVSGSLFPIAQAKFEHLQQLFVHLLGFGKVKDRLLSLPVRAILGDDALHDVASHFGQDQRKTVAAISSSRSGSISPCALPSVTRLM